MGRVYTTGLGGGGGGGSDECTATAGDVLIGQTYIGADTDGEVGTGTLELRGSALPRDVLYGKTFYNNDAKQRLEGALVLTGDATAADVVSGKTFYNTDAEEQVTGTLVLDGNAAAGHVYAGDTFYTTDPKTKITGTMTVNSLLSFSTAVAAGSNVTLTWKNPTAAAGKPFSGVVVRYKTGSAPTGLTDGTQIYHSTGSSTAANTNSIATVTMPALGTTYYFSIWPYATTSLGELYGTRLTSQCTTATAQYVTIKTSQTYTIPAGFTKMDLFLVGGGSSGNGGRTAGGGGGGGGYTKLQTNISIPTSRTMTITIGAGGAGYSFSTHSISSDGTFGNTGGNTSCVVNSTTYTANGGEITKIRKGLYYNGSHGNNGGSGGGGGAAYDRPSPAGSDAPYIAGSGGSNGNSGNVTDAAIQLPGTGQGTTTAYNNIYYAGGGGGGGYCYALTSVANITNGSGGNGGGGAGGVVTADSHNTNSFTIGVAGSANTGGGSGGAAVYNDSSTSSSSRSSNGSVGAGGSGVVVIHLY